jgi:hypothetical protein
MQVGMSAAGIAGAALIFLGSLIAAIGFSGRYGQSYSFLNHFVSELGEIGISKFAWAFNGGLIAGGLLLTFFVLNFVFLMEGWVRFIFLGAALSTGLSGTLVGILPMNNIGPHIVAAMTFFYSGMFSTFSFSLYVLFQKRSIYPKWLSFPGILSALAFFALIFLTKPISSEESQLEVPSPFSQNRPSFWATPFIEWIAVLSILLWVILVAGYYLTRLKPKVMP